MEVKNVWRIAIVLIAWAWALGACAQEGCQDVVYLKNGSVIRGMVLELVPDSTVRIQTADRSIFVYATAEVARIVKEQGAGRSGPMTGPTHGYEGVVSGGYGVRLGQYGLDRAAVDLINGYRFNPHLMAGLGLGVRIYTGGADNNLLMPVFLHARYTPLDRQLSPYAAVSVGTAFNSDRDMNTEGLLLAANLGVSLRVGRLTSLLFGVGLEMQNINVYEYQVIDWQPELVERSVRSSALSLNAGLVF